MVIGEDHMLSSSHQIAALYLKGCMKGTAKTARFILLHDHTLSCAARSVYMPIYREKSMAMSSVSTRSYEAPINLIAEWDWEANAQRGKQGARLNP